MASKKKMAENAALRLANGKKATIKNRKKRVLRRGHDIGEK